MTHIKWIDRDLITSPYCIGLCQSERNFIKEMQRLKVKDIPEWIGEGKDATVHYVTDNKSRGKCCIVCIRERPDTTPSEVIGLIVHEATHCFQWICQDMNEKEPSSEFEAYAIQGISQKLIQEYKIDKKGKGKHKN